MRDCWESQVASCRFHGKHSTSSYILATLSLFSLIHWPSFLESRMKIVWCPRRYVKHDETRISTQPGKVFLRTGEQRHRIISRQFQLLRNDLLLLSLVFNRTLKIVQIHIQRGQRWQWNWRVSLGAWINFHRQIHLSDFANHLKCPNERFFSIKTRTWRESWIKAHFQVRYWRVIEWQQWPGK